MLLLTNCEVHTAKYSDRSFDVRTEWNEVRTKNLRSEYFPYGTNNWLIRALLYSHHGYWIWGPYAFWEVHTALDGPRINQSNREFQSCYTIINTTWSFEIFCSELSFVHCNWLIRIPRITWWRLLLPFIRLKHRLHEYVFISFSSKPQTFLCVFTLHLHENDWKR